jgi:pyruvate dehydrogenase E2 component (dihydrolipoamide acetyltransferase)
MPQLGETVAEGKITQWFKAAGDSVNPGDNLFEIETDKVSMEVPSIAAGTLTEIRTPAGAVVPVGAVVAVIMGEGNASADVPATSELLPNVAPPSMAHTSPASAAAAPRAPSRSIDPFFEVRTPDRNFGPAEVSGITITPLARRLAAENGVNVSRLFASGRRGRITAADVQSAAVVQGSARDRAGEDEASASRVIAIYQGVAFEEVPVERMRRTIAARLVEAKQTIPHFYLSADVAMDALLRVRDDANATVPNAGEGAPPKCSINDFLIKAFAMALQRVPAANAVWAGDRILLFKQSDIGVAVAIDGGLLTPVVRNAERKSVYEISRDMKDLAGRARMRKLKPHEYQGGSCTISNLGMYGVHAFSAIINPPQASILAVGALQRRPVEAERGSVKFANQMTVTLSCDHRVVDGALGAELLKEFKNFVERPISLFV